MYIFVKSPKSVFLNLISQNSLGLQSNNKFFIYLNNISLTLNVYFDKFISCYKHITHNNLF